MRIDIILHLQGNRDLKKEQEKFEEIFFFKTLIF